MLKHPDLCGRIGSEMIFKLEQFWLDAVLDAES